MTLSSCLGLQAAVETGTYLGVGAARLKTVFSRVFSIELSEILHQQAKLRFGDLEGLEFVCGSSPVELPRIVEYLGEPSLFWLDGHWSPGLPMGYEPQCPLLEELAIIDQFEFNAQSCVLIDDAHLFLGPPPPPHRRKDWPTFLEIVDLLRSTHPRFVTVLDNIIIAGPPAIRPILDEYWLEICAHGADPIQRIVRIENPTVPLAAWKLARAIAFALMPERANAMAARRRITKAESEF